MSMMPVAKVMAVIPSFSQLPNDNQRDNRSNHDSESKFPIHPENSRAEFFLSKKRLVCKVNYDDAVVLCERLHAARSNPALLSVATHPHRFYIGSHSRKK